MTKPIRFEHLKPCIDWWKKRKENEVAWKVVARTRSRRATTTSTSRTRTPSEDDHGDPAELLAKLEQSEAETAKLRDQLKAILAEALLR